MRSDSNNRPTDPGTRDRDFIAAADDAMLRDRSIKAQTLAFLAVAVELRRIADRMEWEADDDADDVYGPAELSEMSAAMVEAMAEAKCNAFRCE
jgi:hypothetical protein